MLSFLGHPLAIFYCKARRMSVALDSLEKCEGVGGRTPSAGAGAGAAMA